MATEVFFPKANPVTLHRSTDGQWWTESIPSFEDSVKYCQKFQINDTVAFQVCVKDSSLVGIGCEIVNPSGATLATCTITTLASTFDDDYSQYHISHTITNIADDTQCFIKLVLSLSSGRTWTYYSEPLHVRTTWPNTLEIKYSHDENDFNMIFYDAVIGDEDNKIDFTLRVEGGLKSDGFQPTSSDEIYRNDRADVTTVSSTPFLVLKFSFGDSKGIPNYLADIINRIFSCYYVQINSVYYNKAENAKFEATRSDNYPMAGWTLDLVEDEDMNGFDNFPFDMGRIYWLYRGPATTLTNPGTPTEDIFYMAVVDTKADQVFTHFGGLTVSAGEQAALRYDTTDDTWYKDVFTTIPDSPSIEIATIDVSLTAGVKATVDPSAATPAITKPLFMYQVFQSDGTNIYPMPGIQMYYNVSDDKWYIEAQETTTVTVKMFAWSEPLT